MRTLLTASLAALAFGVPAAAGNNSGFEATFDVMDLSEVQLNIEFSEDLAYRFTNENPDKRVRNTDFGSHGNYGEREMPILQEDLVKDLTRSLSKSGISVSDTAPYVLTVTIVDARNSHPTLRQMSKEPGLSMRSVGLGGAELQATLMDVSGAEIGTMSYAWYESRIETAGLTTWSDANRAFERFSRKAADHLDGND